MYFADFETTTGKISMDKSWVWLWGVKGLMPEDKLEWDISGINSFLSHVKNNDLSPIYFHNLGFDGDFIYKHLLCNGYEFVDTVNNEEAILTNRTFSWVCDERSNVFSLDINIDGFIAKFYCSWRVLMASVEKLGKSLGEYKLDLNYDLYSTYYNKKDVPIEVVNYLERDIDVVQKSFSKAISLYDKKMTLASMSFNDFQTFYDEENQKNQFAYDFGGFIFDPKTQTREYHNVLSKEDWLFVNKSYTGGYTNWNKNFTNKEIFTPKGVSIDTNSMYPAMMREKIPYGKLLDHKPAGDFAELVCVLIKKGELKEGRPPLVRRKKRLTEETEFINMFQEPQEINDELLDDLDIEDVESKFLSNFEWEERVYWRQELEFIEKHYKLDYKIIKIKYFKTKYVFKNWVDSRQHLKINAKDKVEQDFHKTILNGCYGKYGQNIRMGSKVIIRDGKIVREIDGEKWLVYADTFKPYVKLGKRLRYGNDGEFVHDYVFSETENRKHVGVASYITMLARITLWTAIFNNLDIWLYSDTDSCYFLDEPKGVEIHPTKFGAWKVESKFKRIKILRAKSYIYEQTRSWDKKLEKLVKDEQLIRKISGLSDDGKKAINFDNFSLGYSVKEGKKSMRNVSGGKIMIKSDFKLGEDLLKYVTTSN